MIHGCATNAPAKTEVVTITRDISAGCPKPSITDVQEVDRRALPPFEPDGRYNDGRPAMTYDQLRRWVDDLTLSEDDKIKTINRLLKENAKCRLGG